MELARRRGTLFFSKMLRLRFLQDYSELWADNKCKAAMN